MISPLRGCPGEAERGRSTNVKAPPGLELLPFAAHQARLSSRMSWFPKVFQMSLNHVPKTDRKVAVFFFCAESPNTVDRCSFW
jgi:hypothetical protein